jgi:hypothetical protein
MTSSAPSAAAGAPEPPSGAGTDEAAPPPASTVSVRVPGSTAFRLLEEPVFEGGPTAARKLNDLLMSSMQMQHLLLFAGSGTSLHCGYPGMGDLYSRVSKLPEFDKALKKVKHPVADRNFEELLSRCDAHLLLESDKTVENFRRKAIDEVLSSCRAPEPLTKLESHQAFLLKLARRRARDARLKLFTTNYDLCFERAASAVGMIPIDGFSLGHPRRFDPRFFDYDIVRRDGVSETSTFVPGVFQYFKIHGSVDWAARGDGTEVDVSVGADNACLVYPARTKYQRTFEQPHLELVAHYLAALRQANTCLVVLGFGFYDDHLTRPILSALQTNPHFRMIVVDPYADSNLERTEGNWPRLDRLSTTADLTFVKAKFDEFVALIPDLTALSPAQELAIAVQKVAAKA